MPIPDDVTGHQEGRSVEEGWKSHFVDLISFVLFFFAKVCENLIAHPPGEVSPPLDTCTSFLIHKFCVFSNSNRVHSLNKLSLDLSKTQTVCVGGKTKNSPVVNAMNAK